MATNPYFSHGVSTEQNVFECLTIEAIKIYGQDVQYLPRDVVNLDNILQEDIMSSYADAFAVEMYIEAEDGFGGEGDLFQKFGMEIRDEVTFIVARKRWVDAVGDNTTSQKKPSVGDLIYLPLSKSLFEISFVEHEKPFYQLNNLVVYKISCRLFELSESDTFNTGIADIDSIEQKSAYVTSITLDSGTVSGQFLVSETISHTNVDGVTITGEVASITDNGDSTHTLTIFDMKTDSGGLASFTVGNAITAGLSGASGNVSDIPELVFANDPIAQNAIFEAESDTIIDFTESNPFGDVT